MELDIQYGPDIAAKRWIIDGKYRFDAERKIALHPVGTTQEDQLIAAIVKHQHPGMFQVAIHDADNFNVFAKPFEARHYAADAPHNQADFYAGSGGFIEFGNDLLVFEAVDFQDHFSLLAFFGGFYFVFNKFV